MTFDLWPVLICTQIVQCLSLTTACIPYLQPFLLSLESGFLRGDEFRRQSIKDYTYGSSRPSKSTPSTRRRPSDDFRSRQLPAENHSPAAGYENEAISPPAIAMLPLPTAGEPFQAQRGRSWDSRSASSQVGLTESGMQAPVAVDTRRCELEGY